MTIEATFKYDDGSHAGTLRLEHIPRVGDTVLWLTLRTNPGGTQTEHDYEYPVKSVRWTVNADGDRDPSYKDPLVDICFGPTADPDQH